MCCYGHAPEGGEFRHIASASRVGTGTPFCLVFELFELFVVSRDLFPPFYVG